MLLQTLASHLETIEIEAGNKHADCRESIQTLDTQVEAFIRSAKEAGLGDPDHKERDIFPSADVRTAEFEQDIRLRAEYPESQFPMAADVLCRQVSEWFRRELLLFAKTTQLSRTLLVEVSGLLSGPHTSLTDSPVTAQKEYEAKVKQLRKADWVFRKRYGHLEITGCSANLEKINQVIAWMGGEMPGIKLRDGSVQEFSFRIPSGDCKEVFHALSGEKDLKERQKGEIVTEDEAAVVQRNLKDIRFALSSLRIMDDWSIILSLLRSYTANIEYALGCSDLSCAKAIQVRHEVEAKKNRCLRERQEAAGQEALDTLDLQAAYDKIEKGIQKAISPLGLYVMELYSFDYASTRLSAIPNTFFDKRTLRPDLEMVQEPGDRTMYLLNNPANIDRMAAVVHETMPGAKLESLEVAAHDFGQIIKKVVFTITPADIALMLEKTKDMEEVDPF